MPPSTLNESDLGRLGLETPIARIDRALKLLWEGDEAKTRASLINLAIYTEDSARADRDNDLLDHVAAQHACRAMLILALPRSQPPRARAWIQALCRPYQGKQIVCSEQISFVLEGGNAAQVQNIVFAHLDSDLPLVVWWQADLTKNFEERLYSRIDTLIIDSSRWSDPARQFDALLTADECRDRRLRCARPRVDALALHAHRAGQLLPGRLPPAKPRQAPARSASPISKASAPPRCCSPRGSTSASKPRWSSI
jgi:hypothetical protein